MKTSHAAVLVIVALLAIGVIAFQIGSTMSPVVTVTQTTVSPGYYSSGTPQPYYGFSSDPPSIFITTLSHSSYPKVVVVGSASQIMRVFKEIWYLEELSDLSPVASDPIGWLKSHPGVLFNNYAAFKGVAYFEGREVTTTVTKTVDLNRVRAEQAIRQYALGKSYPYLARNVSFSEPVGGSQSTDGKVTVSFGVYWLDLQIDELRLSPSGVIEAYYIQVYDRQTNGTWSYDALAIER